ncbi:DNA-binding NarL/FixJ family response regulator [Nitrosomonas sp. Nm84]|uniref:response regulator transcription factor n=1 Tax=Nitrosomonas sp. Nm84 TaxID=200124 RepID=UPI000D755C95|nr:response regulator transcription factor [Nitrosomonas sp. Nm84]PXW91201.1 DNA-binding NarL/FixJ family response regulator [Nitrosomonas sp. Nm84]
MIGRTKIRVLVAESFELVRIGLRSLFQNHAAISLVAETSHIEDLFYLAVQHKPDVILVDLQLSNGNYAEHIAKLLDTCPRSRVLAFSQHDSEHVYLQTYRSGVVGVISKHHSCKLLLKAIYAIHAGQAWFDRHIAQLTRQEQLDRNTLIQRQIDLTMPRQPKLSDSERRIAYLACKGLSAKEISLRFFITERTVRNQLSTIYRKIGVKKQIELCLKAPRYNYFK